MKRKTKRHDYRTTFLTEVLAADLLAKVDAAPHNGKMSLRDAAKLSGVSPATLSRVARNKPCDVETLARLCDFLKQPASRYVRAFTRVAKP